jgi:uncharacterized DUF497 family protein
MRFGFDKRKSAECRNNSRRGIGFEEVQQIWEKPYYLDQRSEDPEQWRAIGWVGGRLFSVIYEERADKFGEYLHLVTLWQSTKEERRLYEKKS